MKTVFRFARRAGIGLVILITLIALFYAIEDWRGARSWERARARLASEGIPLDWRKLAPPKPPPEQNFVTPLLREYIEAAREHPAGERGAFDLPALKLSTVKSGPKPGVALATRTDLREWVRGLELSNSENLSQIQAAKLILDHLSPMEPLVQSLSASRNLPGASFDADFGHEPVWEMPFTHGTVVQNAAKALRLHAVANLAEGNTAAALDDIGILLRFARTLDDEPAVVSLLVSNLVASWAVGAIWEGLSEHAWSDAQLRAIIEDLQKLDRTSALHRSMEGELIFFVCGMEYIQRQSGIAPRMVHLYNSFNGLPEPNAVVAAMPRFFPSGWWDQSKALAAETYTKFLIASIHPAAETGPRIDPPIDSDIIAGNLPKMPWSILVKIALPVLASISEPIAMNQDQISMAIIACALDRYWLAEGHFPSRAAGLPPRFLDKLPRDAATGGDFIYRPSSDGRDFTLYSLGRNGIDDGGKVFFKANAPAKIDPARGDWVWPRTAALAQ